MILPDPVLYFFVSQQPDFAHPLLFGGLLTGGLRFCLVIIEVAFSRVGVQTDGHLEFLAKTTGREGFFAAPLGLGTSRGMLVALWDGVKDQVPAMEAGTAPRY